jgi:AraC-like DNA-binding protein
MNTTTHIDAISVFIFLGVFQGLILSVFFIFKSTSESKANIFQGLLLLSLTLCILEQFLNLTGYITRVLPITNYSEWLNLTIGPLLYLYIRSSTEASVPKKNWLQFLPAFLYLAYLIFDFIQPNEIKYNSYVYSYHPDWPRMQASQIVSQDPLDLKSKLNAVTGIHLVIYAYLSLRLLIGKCNLKGETIFNTGDTLIRSLRNMVLHIITVFVIFVIVKLCFKGDLGDYYIGTYISVINLITSFRVMNDSSYFDRSNPFMDLSINKYSKSSLNEPGKKRILDSIKYEFEVKRYYADNLASLAELAKRTGESPHHVSQVINEKLGQSFFELLASYRVEEAKKIMSSDNSVKITIEEISEMVGYNSKTAFNNAFKKITGKTPSEYRKSSNI